MTGSYDFSFEATSRLGTDALNCLLWKRGRLLGPIALILLPIVLFIAQDSASQTLATGFAGAAIMLLIIFLLAFSIGVAPHSVLSAAAIEPFTLRWMTVAFPSARI